MRRVTILCTGRLKERFYLDAAAEYVKRLGRFCSLSILELPEEKLPEKPSDAEIAAALRKEAAAVESRIPAGAFKIALCVEGRRLDSVAFSRLVAPQGQLAFLIGSSFGLDETLKARCDARISMSDMTFPHHLARVMLLEQLYRAYQIEQGSRYHK